MLFTGGTIMSYTEIIDVAGVTSTGLIVGYESDGDTVCSRVNVYSANGVSGYLKNTTIRSGGSLRISSGGSGLAITLTGNGTEGANLCPTTTSINN